MKLYSDKPGASIQMSADAEFKSILQRIIANENIRFVFESGTYLGTGSTATIAELFLSNNKIPERFITVEANFEYYTAAKNNLLQYAFIEPVFGLSVDWFDAVKFIVNDEVFNTLHQYPDVFIDHIKDPQKFYLQEIMIGFFQSKIEKTGPLKKTFFGKPKIAKPDFINNVLSVFGESIADNTTSLIILDSAAGIGFYEFLQVKKTMAQKSYYLVLDDIDHLKHFRSRLYIQNNPQEFELIGLNKESGWLIAKSLLIATEN